MRLTINAVGKEKSHCQEPGYGSVPAADSCAIPYTMCDVLIERRRKYVTHVIRALRIVLQTHYNALTNKTCLLRMGMFLGLVRGTDVHYTGCSKYYENEIHNT
jgi:hypothetical protein